MTRRVQSLDLYIFAKRELVLVLDQSVGSRRMGSGIGLDGRAFGMVGKLEPRNIHQSIALTVGANTATHKFLVSATVVVMMVSRDQSSDL